MTDMASFAELLISGWDDDIQDNITLNIYEPLCDIDWRLETLSVSKEEPVELSTINTITRLLLQAFSSYESMVLAHYYMENGVEKPKPKEEKKAKSSELTQIEKEIRDSPTPKFQKYEKNDDEKTPIEKFHDGMGIIKSRVDGMVFRIREGNITMGKVYMFCSEIRNIMQFIYSSMDATKKIQSQKKVTSGEAIRASVENNVIPIMVERHVHRGIPKKYGDKGLI